jgi:hypothetical protein
MDCPNCETEFDWANGDCPTCGWSREEQDANLQTPWGESNQKTTSKAKGWLARLKRYL